MKSRPPEFIKSQLDCRFRIRIHSGRESLPPFTVSSVKEGRESTVYVTLIWTKEGPKGCSEVALSSFRTSSSGVETQSGVRRTCVVMISEGLVFLLLSRRRSRPLE